MNIIELENYLFQVNEYEIKQKETGISVNDYPMYSDTNRNTYTDQTYKIVRLPKEMFFSGDNSIIVLPR